MMDPYADRQRSATGSVGGPKKMLVEFVPPDDLELEGEKGTGMVNWVMTPNGRIRITSFEGVSIGDGGDMDEDD